MKTAERLSAITVEKQTSSDLNLQIREKGLCRQCGGCVTFCESMAYGGIESQNGFPAFKKDSGCEVDCRLCYMICPVIGYLKDDVRKMVFWSPPEGRIIAAYTSRRKNGGSNSEKMISIPLTSLLLYLFDSYQIDGAIFTARSLPGGQGALLVTNREGLLETEKSRPEKKSDPEKFRLPSYSKALIQARQTGLRRLVFVGMPCEIEATRNMQVLGIEPADRIKFRFGLFCSTYQPGNTEIKKMNESGNALRGCDLCPEFYSELADISFGRLFSSRLKDTVLIRTSKGWDAFVGAMRKDVLDVVKI